MATKRRFTIGIVLPLEEEYMAVQQVLSVEESWHQGHETFYRIQGDLPVPAVAVVVGAMGQEVAGVVAERLMTEFGVRLLVIVGICGALAKDLALGDVVAPTVVDLYSAGAKAVPAGKKHRLILAGEPFRTPQILVRAVADLKRRPERRAAYDKWAEAAGPRRRALGLVHPTVGTFCADKPEVHQGHLASGSDVAATAAYGEWLKTFRDRSYLAVEMEAGGISVAANRRMAPLPVLVLRGVSDFADERKAALDAGSDRWPEGAWRAYAVQNAVGLLPVLLRDESIAAIAAPSKPAPGARTAATQWRTMSSETVGRLGRRRTAYPLDLSIAELHDEDLLVATVSKVGRRTADVTAADHATELAQGRSSLLLGEPGAGKTVALYEIAQACIAQGLLPIVCRARHLAELPDALGIAAVRNDARARVVLLIDGLDEALTEWTGAGGVGARFVAAASVSPVLATSRLNEFHESGELQATVGWFHRIYHLQAWRSEVEFASFLRKLDAAGRPAPTGLRVRVARSRDLRRLVSRPLYARMLTYVGGNEGGGITSAHALYGAYIGRLARITDRELGERGLTSPIAAIDCWKEIAWGLHARGAQTTEPVVAPDMLDELLAHAPSPETQSILLGYLFDATEHAGRQQLDFVHHSFYEYLLATAVLDRLLASTDPASVGDSLGRDLTREVRHHLVMQMRGGYGGLLADRLASAYAVVAPQGAAGNRRSLAAANLAAYLLSRLSRDTRGLLRELLARETLMFLRLALIWALCHVSDKDALRDFVCASEDHDWRSHVRGYVLYYYGDLPRDSWPPYRDTAPYVPCTLSRRRVLTMMTERSYRRAIPVERRYVDAYSYLDVLHVRSVLPSAKERRALERIADHVLTDLHDVQTGTLLQAKLEAVLG
jgi:nucleoside phosphorylase